jgi:glycerol-3-phosphate acyltransferase PlsX
MSRLLLDVMGGDHAPKAILDGALAALKDLRHPLVLIGDEAKIRKHPIAKVLSEGPGANAEGRMSVSLVHAGENIEMEDKIKAIRGKPNAPINVGTRLAAESWKAFHNAPSGPGPDAFVSAGHSGAVMASALLTLGRIKGIERPAIATRLPTLNGKGVVCLDVGANVDCKPEHLRDFAIMGAIFATAGAAGLTRPKVGVLANGEERTKGNDLTRATYAILEGHPLFTGTPTVSPVGEFVGYCEAKEMFLGNVDVVVMDGLIGNLILKNSEALGSLLIKILTGEAKKNPLNLLGFGLAWGAIRAFKKKVDFRETGAAPLLGVQGYVFIAHGRSDKLAVRNSLLRAQEALDSKMIERLAVAVAPETSSAGVYP